MNLSRYYLKKEELRQSCPNMMSLAHEEPFGGHLGEEKTRERIKYGLK